MKKALSVFCLSLGLIFGGFIVASAVNCPTSFPASLSDWYTGCTIPSSWANALEQKIGINGSTATSSLDYQINHIFTSYGSEQIATSALPFVPLALTSLSATNPITYNTSTGAIGWTNSLGYLTGITFGGITSSTYQVGTGLAMSASGTLSNVALVPSVATTTKDIYDISVATSDAPQFISDVPATFTLRQVNCYNDNVAGNTFTFNIAASTTITTTATPASSSLIFNIPITCTATSTIYTTSTFATSTIGAGKTLWVEFTAASTTGAHIGIDY